MALMLKLRGPRAQVPNPEIFSLLRSIRFDIAPQLFSIGNMLLMADVVKPPYLLGIELD